MMKHAKQWLGLLGVLAVLGCTAPEMLAQAPGAAEDAVSAPNGMVGQDVGAPSGEVARWKELEAHLSRLESRLEDYRRSQDGALAGMDATWTNRLRAVEAEIDARCDESTQKEVEAIQKQSQTALAKTLEMAQSKHDKDAAELRQCMEKWHTEDISAFKTMRIFFGFLIAALVGLCVLVWKNKTVTDNWRYCFETIVLVAVMLLISWGAYHLLDRIVAYGEKGYAIQAIDSPDAHLATRQAYEQLSNELEHWAVLFGVMGTFFGLVIPVGGYLLQIKAVKREEEKTEKVFDEKLIRFTNKMNQTIKDKTDELDKKFKNETEMIWMEFSGIQYNINLRAFQMFRTQSDRASNHRERLWLWGQWLYSLPPVVLALGHVADDMFVNKRLSTLIRELNMANEKPDCKEMKTEYKQANQEYDSKIGIGLEKLRARFPQLVDELISLLADYGLIPGKELLT